MLNTEKGFFENFKSFCNIHNPVNINISFNSVLYFIRIMLY